MRILSYIVVGLMIIPIFMFRCFIVALGAVIDGIKKC